MSFPPIHRVVTGAGGFVGQVLVQRLLRGGLDGRRVEYEKSTAACTAGSD
jgi:nucleoside-diphosphate-sugar epimerase